MPSPANKGCRYPPEPLTPDEARRLIAAVPGTGPIGLRNRALIAILWRSGLRISEALALYPRDVNHANGTLRVRQGKGGKSRIAVIDTEALTYLRAWLEVRAALGLDGHRPIFCSIKRGPKDEPGHKMDTSAVRRLLPAVAKRAGIEKRVHAHGLRHTHATELVERRVPLHVISGQLGHSNAATTDTYLAKVAPLERVDAMRAAGWTFDPPPELPAEPAPLPADPLF